MAKSVGLASPRQEVHQEVRKPPQVGFGHKELEEEEKEEEEGLGAQGADMFPWCTGFIDVTERSRQKRRERIGKAKAMKQDA